MKIVQNGVKNYTAMYNLRDIMQAYYDSVDSNLLKPFKKSSTNKY